VGAGMAATAEDDGFAVRRKRRSASGTIKAFLASWADLCWPIFGRSLWFPAITSNQVHNVVQSPSTSDKDARKGSQTEQLSTPPEGLTPQNEPRAYGLKIT